MGRSNQKLDIFQYIDMNPPADANHTCWLWKDPAKVSAKGIPYFYYEGKKYVAYRFVYWLVHPDWDISNSREYLLHQCKSKDGLPIDNSLCCNPNHVIPGTHEQNMLDMMLRGRSGLTIDAVRDIIKMKEEFPELTHGQVADRVMYKHKINIARQTVTDILSGRRRKVIQDAIDKRNKEIEDSGSDNSNLNQ